MNENVGTVDEGASLTGSAIGLRIRKIRAQAVGIPLKRPVITPLGVTTHHNVVVATIETDEMTGSYYGWTSSIGQSSALRELVVDIGSRLLGQDASQIRQNRDRMSNAVKVIGRTGLGTIAIGILDACLWDIKGKQAGLPIWKHLGGRGPAPIEAYASAMFLSSSEQELKEEARFVRDSGYKWVKMRIGKSNLDEDLRRIDVVRSALGDEVNLMMDAVMLWDVRTAFRRINAYKQFNPFWIEDPVDYHEGNNLEALAAVTAESPVNIAAGEFLFNVAPFREMIRLKAADFPMVDLEHVGGLSPWLDVLALARDADIRVVPHLFPEMSLHVHCIDGSQLPIEYVPWTRELFTDFPEVNQGSFPVPTHPGIGFNFAWDNVNKWTHGSAQSASS